MPELGRLAYRDALGLIVEADDGRVLAEVALTDGADFYQATGKPGRLLFLTTWEQHRDEPRGYIDAEAVEIPIPAGELGAGNA